MRRQRNSHLRKKCFALRELLKAEVFSDEQDLLPMLIWTKDFSTLPDNENSKVRIEQAKKVFGIRNNITSWMRIGRQRTDLNRDMTQ